MEQTKDEHLKKKSKDFNKILLNILVIITCLGIIYLGYSFVEGIIDKIKQEQAIKALKENELKLAKQEEERVKEEKRKRLEARKFYTQNLEWINVDYPENKNQKWKDDGWSFYKLKHKDMFYSFFQKENNNYRYVSFEAYAENGKKYELEFEEINSPNKKNQYGSITLSLVKNEGYSKLSGVCSLGDKKIRLLRDLELSVDQIKEFYDLMPEGDKINCSVDGTKVEFNISDWQIVLFTDFSSQNGM